MTTRILKGVVPATAAEVIDRLSDERSFSTCADDIVSVDGGRWVLAFRGGTMSWTQSSSTVDKRIEFAQTGGDFQSFQGSWTATDLPEGGCEVVYEVKFSTSVPHLAGAIDSAAGRVLVRAAHQIIAAVGGPVRVTSGGHFLADLPQSALV